MSYWKLIEITFLKERVFYKRLGRVFGENNNAIYKILVAPIISSILVVSHYCFAGMHFLFESFLYIFNRGQYERNIVKLQRSLS